MSDAQSNDSVFEARTARHGGYPGEGTSERHTPARPCVSGRPREEDEAYPNIVAVLNARWRVIVCRTGIQWILQRRAGTRHGRPRWDGNSYCQTREALLRCISERAGPCDPSALANIASLPAHIHDTKPVDATAKTAWRDE
jgi:hypothetical protein